MLQLHSKQSCICATGRADEDLEPEKPAEDSSLRSGFMCVSITAAEYFKIRYILILLKKGFYNITELLS